MLALAFFALAGASEVWIVGRSHGGWRVEVFDPDLTLDALFIAEVRRRGPSESDAATHSKFHWQVEVEAMPTLLESMSLETKCSVDSESCNMESKIHRTHSESQNMDVS